MGELTQFEQDRDRLREFGPDIFRLYEKMSRKVEAGRGIHLSPDDLDILAQFGVLKMLASLATEYQVRKCQERNVKRRSISEATLASTGAPTARISKSSGTTPPDSVNEALALAQAICRRPN